MTDQTQEGLSPREIALREQRRAEMAETEFQTSSQGGALMQPRNGRELMDMANTMAGSKQMVRDFYRGSPGDCAALIMICAPYGLNPFLTSWKTYKASKSADAPVSFEGQLVNAMVNLSAPVKGRLRYTYEGEGPTRKVTVIGIDRETGDEIPYTSPMLKDIPIKNSPLWKSDPDQQLGYYGARSWARRHFPELLLGIYTREEIEEAPMRDINPQDRPKTKAQRMIEAARAEADAKAKPLDGEIMDEDTEPADDGTAPEHAGDGEDTAGAEQRADTPGGSKVSAVSELKKHPAFAEGQQAFREGFLTVDQCPHKDGTEDDKAWRLGFADAAAREG